MTVSIIDKEEIKVPGRMTKWQPKQWNPVYEQVVMYSCMNKTAKEIGKIVGFTEVHVGNILRSRFAKVIKLKMYEDLREDVSKTITNNIADSAILAARRIKAVLENEELAEKHPLSIFDRSLQVLKATKHVAGGENNAQVSGNVNFNGKTNILITTEAAKQLKDAIQKSDEGRKMLTEVIVK